MGQVRSHKILKEEVACKVKSGPVTVDYFVNGKSKGLKK